MASLPGRWTATAQACSQTHPGASFFNDPKTTMNSRQPRSSGSYNNNNNRSKRWESNGSRERPRGNQNAQRSYERYLALAQAEAQAGDRVAAENYYQHAEHYYRMMSSNPETA